MCAAVESPQIRVRRKVRRIGSNLLTLPDFQSKNPPKVRKLDAKLEGAFLTLSAPKNAYFLMNKHI